jgi:hypothetical protein
MEVKDSSWFRAHRPAYRVRCPLCGVDPMEHCRSSGDNLVKPHVDRILKGRDRTLIDSYVRKHGEAT